jgi:hypothetical protein
MQSFCCVRNSNATDAVKISVRYPGVQADDPRITVTLQEVGTPWPIRFHFLNIADDESGQIEHREYLHVGFELGEQFASMPGTPLRPLTEEPEPLDPIAVQRVASKYVTYLEFARHAIVLDQEGITGALRRLRPGRKPARLTDDFYRLVADDFRARREGTSAPLKELAAANHVDISTASRWVKEARRRGYLEAANG